MSKFTVPESPIEVVIEYYQDKKENLVFLNPDSDNYQMEKKENKDKIKKLTAKFHPSGWARVNEYQKNVFNWNSETKKVDINESLLRMQKLRYLLVSLVDEDEGDIKINNIFFENMVPDLGYALLSAYDRKFGNI